MIDVFDIKKLYTRGNEGKMIADIKNKNGVYFSMQWERIE